MTPGTPASQPGATVVFSVVGPLMDPLVDTG
ncbi:hypothetical protein Ae168Ps1_3794c [Pseudonocardia sp. Ae168_Ps1]|nr:hypothetical protein Ae150APs1_3771c [Pseudonocardia sp. Ae150A_Ps1]OLL81388.1 hypothetical protein Ae168Ps1_3794c [Pseudonocardia sp. Ae168_Ps1]OLL84498.1 hypothetical protein Ae263Ps1_1553 [Pseudonocardia sp. Ae263_Ps1]OLL95482.1 hypothetical protein Ae356Ps1_5379c [Pseudonocardia sp. Ae356_Ps1]